MASFEKNKSSGLWTCRFREIDIDGAVRNKRLSGKFKTKKEAQYAYEDYIAKKAETDEKRKRELALANDPMQMTFGELLEKYFEHKKGRIRESSYYDIENKISTNIVPFFSQKKICEIQPSTVVEWQNKLMHLSYTYRKDLNGLLSSILSYGVRYHKITSNVVKDAERPRRLERKKEMLFWTPEEFASAISEVKGDVYRVFFTFLYFTGCREGEAFALSWQDIDLVKKRVNINKSLTRKAHDGDKSYKIGPPKNDASYRRIPMPDSLCRILAEYKEQCEDGRFVFGGDKPLSSSTCERRLTAAASLANVKRIRIHDLRHSCATLLVHNKVSIVTISRHLGHSDVTQTLNTYSHAFPDDNDELVEVLSETSKMLI